MSLFPTLHEENALFSAGVQTLVSFDEVGRGAIAGPVAVGAVVLQPNFSSPPEGIRDSKLLSAKKREQLEPLCKQWVGYWSIGWASPAEIDQNGIIHALSAAAYRACGRLEAQGVDMGHCTVLLDGSYDYLSLAYPKPLQVKTMVKADQKCVSVAAASIIAKKTRDELMGLYHDQYPNYGWDSNKGYATAKHRSAIEAFGISEYHRATWIN